MRLNISVLRMLKVNRLKCLFALFISITTANHLCGNERTRKETINLKPIKAINNFYKGYFSPDGKNLALIGESKVEILQILSNDVISKIDFSPDTDVKIFSTSFTPDGRSLGISYYTNQCKKSETTKKMECELTQNISLFDISSGKKIKDFWRGKIENSGGDVSFSKDGSYLAAMTDTAKIWDVKTGTEFLDTLIASGNRICGTLLSSNGKWLATYSSTFTLPSTQGTFYINDLVTKERRILNNLQVRDFKFSADSTLLFITSTIFNKHDIGIGTKVTIYKTGTWEILKTIEFVNANETFDISHNNQLLVGGGKEKFSIYSLKTGKLLAEAYHHKKDRLEDLEMTNFLTHVEFSPDDTMLLTGGEDGTVKLWKIMKGKY